MKLKKLICVFLCCVMVLGINVNVFAAVDTYETEEVDNVEYIKFVSNPLARMNSDGTFEFQFTSRVISDKFTANASQIGIITEAYLGTPIGNGQYSYEKDSNISFTMTLKTSSGNVVWKYIGYCNGVRGGYTFNVTKGNVYYIELATASDLAPRVKYIMGDGVVTNVTVN